MFKFFCLTLILLGSVTTAAVEKIKVVTTLPDLAEVVRTVGGDKVEVDSLLKGSEDSHFLDAVPTYIRLIANSDVVCFMGLDLESGWLPKVLSKSGNAKVQPGGLGYCEMGKAVSVLEKPSGNVDRSMGDVHLYGNPHFNLSPKALSEAAVVVEKTLSETRPEFSEDFKKGLKNFQSQMTSLKESVDKKIKPLQYVSRGRPLVIEYHKEFTYFFNVYGLKSFGSIEDKPGVPPSATRLSDVAKGAKASKVCMAFAALYTPDNQLQKFSEISGIAFKKLPAMVQKNNEKFNTIEKLQNALVESVLSCPLLSAKDKG